MPVTGLPAAVESALNTLMATNYVTSWKIAAEGRKAVFILRLCSDQASDRPQAPDSVHHTYRKKPPSQIRRDHARAAKWRTEVGLVESGDSDCSTSKDACVSDKPEENNATIISQSGACTSEHAEPPPTAVEMTAQKPRAARSDNTDTGVSHSSTVVGSTSLQTVTDSFLTRSESAARRGELKIGEKLRESVKSLPLRVKKKTSR